MSKKSKKAASEVKRRKKASAKQAQKATYAAYRDSGRNSKSKRFIQNNKSNKMRARTHPHGHCGNIGCKTCYPKYNTPELLVNIRGLEGLNYALFD